DRARRGMLIEIHIAAARTAGDVGYNAIIGDGGADDGIIGGRSGIADIARRYLWRILPRPTANAARIVFPKLAISHDQEVAGDRIYGYICPLYSEIDGCVGHG